MASESPSHYAELYSSDGLSGGHMILLSKDEETQVVARRALRDFPNTLQVGGGVDVRNALSYLDDGASHVIVTSSVFKRGELQMDLLERLSGVVGRHRLVLDLSCRRRDHGGDYFVVTDRWQKYTSLKVRSDRHGNRRAGECVCLQPSQPERPADRNFFLSLSLSHTQNTNDHDKRWTRRL